MLGREKTRDKKKVMDTGGGGKRKKVEERGSVSIREQKRMRVRERIGVQWKAKGRIENKRDKKKVRGRRKEEEGAKSLDKIHTFIFIFFG